MKIDDWHSIEGYYDRGEEDTRLTHDFNLERLRTLSIISRFLPPAPAVVYDIGGATGVYAFPLSEKGYEVHLIEPVESQVVVAKKLNESATKPIHRLEVGNALELHRPDSSADAVLLFGPLYHLTSAEKRLRALREAFRVLKPGGIVFSAAISRYASLIDCFQDSNFHEPEVKKMVIEDIHSGQHRCPTGKDLFTTAYFHLPAELKKEHEEAGFLQVRIMAVEGPVWSVKDELMKSSGALEARLELLHMIEEDRNLICASAHIMAIGRTNK